MSTKKLRAGATNSFEIPTDEVLTQFDSPAWAWQFLQQNIEFQSAVNQISIPPSTPPSSISIYDAKHTDRLRSWGIAALVSDLGERAFTPLWLPQLSSSVLRVHMLASGEYGIDFRQLKVFIAVVRDRADEHVLLRSGSNAIQLHIVDGSVLNGPVELAFPVGSKQGNGELHTLDRFLTLTRQGTIPSPKVCSRRTTRRWTLALKIYPLVRAGLSDREIAAHLFPAHDTTKWTSSNDWLRTQIRRARHLSVKLVNGGYLKLLSPANVDRVDTL